MPVTSEKYSDVVATQMTKLFRPPFACTVEQWIQTPNGMRCFSWSAKSMLDNAKAVVSIVAIGHDITRSKHDLKTTRKKDEELMLVVESGRQMYYTHSPEHMMIFVSPRIRSLLGCKPRAGNWAWTDYLTDNPINAAALERTIRAISTGKREPPYRLEMKGANGKTIWFEANEIPVVKNGKTVSIVGSMIDISERMKVEEGATEAELLIKDYRNPVIRPYGQDIDSEPVNGPFGFLRSIFSKKAEEADSASGEGSDNQQ